MTEKIEFSERVSYSTSRCSSPGCDKNIPDEKQKDHLGLCDEHQKNLDDILKEYRRGYDIKIPDNMSDDETYTMVYKSLLPSIDQLIRQLSLSTGTYS